VGSESLYRSYSATSPPPTPIIIGRCSHRPLAHHFPTGSHSSLSPHTRARPRAPRVLPLAVAPSPTHPLPACPTGHAPPFPLRRTRAIAPAPAHPRHRARVPLPLKWRQPPRSSAPTTPSVAIPTSTPSPPVVSANGPSRCLILDHPWPIIWLTSVSRARRSSGASLGSCQCRSAHARALLYPRNLSRGPRGGAVSQHWAAAVAASPGATSTRAPACPSDRVGNRLDCWLHTSPIRHVHVSGSFMDARSASPPRKYVGQSREQ